MDRAEVRRGGRMDGMDEEEGWKGEERERRLTRTEGCESGRMFCSTR